MFDRLTGRSATPITGLTPEQAIQLTSMERTLAELTQRLTRIETRLVLLMKREGIDHYGNPLERNGTK